MACGVDKSRNYNIRIGLQIIDHGAQIHHHFIPLSKTVTVLGCCCAGFQKDWTVLPQTQMICLAQTEIVCPMGNRLPHLGSNEDFCSCKRIRYPNVEFTPIRDSPI